MAGTADGGSGSQAVVVYDLTRLMNRRLRPLPTGIDRIDLHFARAVLDRGAREAVFVVHARGTAVPVGHGVAVRLVAALERSWAGQGRVSAPQSRGLELAGLTDSFGPVYDASRPGLHRNALRYARMAPFWAIGTTVRHLRRDARERSLREHLAGRRAVYVAASHHGLARRPGLLPDLRRQLGLSVVAFIHDLIPIDHPDLVRDGAAAAHTALIGEYVQAGARFMANSHDTARRLAAYCARLRYAAGDIAVVAPAYATARATAPAAVNGAHAPYFVVVGTIEPRKNLDLLLAVWQRLAEMGDRVPALHVVGVRGWARGDTFTALDAAKRSGHVHEHGRLDDAALATLFAGARALLMPSFAEGFGMPIAEALSAGVPVIASDLAVYREFAADGPDYLDPRDVAGWASTIIDYARPQSERRAAQLARIGAVAPRTWADAVADFNRTLDRLITGDPPG